MAEASVVIEGNDEEEPAQYLDFTVTPRVALTEGPHLDVDGVLLPSSDAACRMSVSYHGMTPGVIEITSMPDGLQAELDGTLRTFPVTIPVDGLSAAEFGLRRSPTANPADAFTLEARYRPYGCDDGFSSVQELTFAQLTVEAEADWPSERHRHVFGPLESGALTISPASLDVQWREGVCQAAGSTFSLTPAQSATNLSVRATVNGIEHEIPIRFIAPVSCVATSACVMAESDWQATGLASPGPNGMGIGLYTELKLMPDYVSFAGLHIQEGVSPAYGAWGYYAPYAGSIGPHGPREGAYRDAVVVKGNGFGCDRAGHAMDEIPSNLSLGGFEYRIPMYWSVDSTLGACFVTNVQAVTIYPNTDVKVSKFRWAARSHVGGTPEVTQE